MAFSNRPQCDNSIPPQDPNERIQGTIEFCGASTVGEVLAAGTSYYPPAVHRMVNPTYREVLEYAERSLKETKATKTEDRAFLEDACAGCGKKKGDDTEALKLCTGCKKAMYCGKEGQKKDWKTHKKICKKL